MSQNSSDAPESRWVDDIVRVMDKLGGTASLEEINAEILLLRTELSNTWQNTIRRTIQQHSSDSNTKKLNQPDLFFSAGGLGSGVWGLRSHVPDTPVATDTPQEVELPAGEITPGRREQTTYRRLRDSELARQLKLLHRNRCQICETAMEISAGKTYSEAHHIVPLGKHHGSDVPENILVLCPNHHVLCDYGAMRLELPELILRPGHVISTSSIRYHNEHIYGRVV